MTTDVASPQPLRDSDDVATVVPDQQPEGDTSDDTGTGDGDATRREQEGLPNDALILVPPVTSVTRLPENVWAMLVVAADLAVDDGSGHAGEVDLFAGSWLTTQPPAGLCDGDLVVRLTEPEGNQPGDRAVDVEMLFSRQGSWQLVGQWPDLNEHWPWVAAPTAAATMALHNDLRSDTPLPLEPASDAPAKQAAPKRYRPRPIYRMAGLLDAGLLAVGDQLVWHRLHAHVTHVAHVGHAGRIQLEDGTDYASPSGAITALGVPNVSGWKCWRVADGRTLSQLRDQWWHDQNRA